MATNTSSRSSRAAAPHGDPAPGGRRKVRHTTHSAALPVLRPVVPGARKRKVPGALKPTIGGLLRAVIEAVNARGMCAASAARIAALPTCDMDDIEALCRCADCLRLRAH